MRIDPASWPVLSRLLDECLDLPEPSRAAWLESLGPEHASVLPLLRQMLETENALDTLPKMLQPASVGAPGGHIGPYRLLRELGQGGMGVVWQAERTDSDIKRTVALKAPLVHFQNPAFAGRFVRERDILAQLTHPNIARLYDAGVTDQGQPYLALEYIEGQKVTAWCDDRALSLEKRLRLFLQVLRAVQFAHTNLIVHRDLKPANILVTKEGDVRLLDFGIAKLVTEGGADETELTRIGGRALTPDYASPEQITGATISTASDVYSLGVILYELLTGDRPYKLKRSTGLGLEQAILSTDPPRPSQTTGDPLKAQARSTTPARLSRSLRGDLDTIVRKALQKQPHERYATADAFAQDIQRYLDGEPVLAQPESRWYRAGKFIRRNRLAVASAAAIVVALAAGLSAALWQAHVAQVQTRTAEAVQSFLLDIFRANSNEHADPLKARQTTARELLDLGANQIDGALNDAPAAKLNLLETLFHLYVDFNLQDQAVALGRRRVALAKSVYGPTHPEVARALVDLAADSGESSFANDRPALVKEAGSILDRNRDFTSRTRALCYLAMGNAVVDKDIAKSGEYADRAVQLLRRYPPSLDLVAALNLMGQRQNIQEEYPQAIVTLSEAARVATSLQGVARRPLPAIYAVLGNAQRHVLDFTGAEKSLRMALQVARSVKGDDSVDVLQTKYRLGVFLFQTGHSKDGLALFQQAVDQAVRTLAPGEVFHTPMVQRAYGVNLLLYGDPEESLPLLSQVLETGRRARLTGTTDFASTLEWTATSEIELGHYRQAATLLDQAAAIYSNRGSTPSSGQLNDLLIARARYLTATGKPAEALAALGDFHDTPERSAPLATSWLDVSIARANAAVAQGQPQAAIDQAREVRLRIDGSGVAPYFGRWEAPAALAEGRGLLMTNRAAEALPLLQRAAQLASELYDPQRSPALADSQIALGLCLLRLGRRDEARVWLSHAQAIHATHRELGEQYRRPLRDLQTRLLQSQ
jgi:serine/threonine-protein kinase